MAALSITSFCSLNILIAISHCSFYLNIRDGWQTQNILSLWEWIPHLPSIDMQLVKTFDKFMTMAKL